MAANVNACKKKNEEKYEEEGTSLKCLHPCESVSVCYFRFIGHCKMASLWRICGSRRPAERDGANQELASSHLAQGYNEVSDIDEAARAAQ